MLARIFSYRSFETLPVNFVRGLYFDGRYIYLFDYLNCLEMYIKELKKINKLNKTIICKY